MCVMIPKYAYDETREQAVAKETAFAVLRASDHPPHHRTHPPHRPPTGGQTVPGPRHDTPAKHPGVGSMCAGMTGYCQLCSPQDACCYSPAGCLVHLAAKAVWAYLASRAAGIAAAHREQCRGSAGYHLSAHSAAVDPGKNQADGGVDAGWPLGQRGRTADRAASGRNPVKAMRASRHGAAACRMSRRGGALLHGLQPRRAPSDAARDAQLRTGRGAPLRVRAPAGRQAIPRDSGDCRPPKRMHCYPICPSRT